MGHSKAAKSDSRQRILEIAARRFREHGVEGLGIAELMEEAGLTHGGFYRHFESRDELVAQAIEAALQQNVGRVSRTVERAGKDSLRGLLDRYLSLAHRDAPGEGCTVAALAADVARSSEQTRSAYTRHVQQFLEIIVKALDGDTAKATRKQAICTLSAMVGALALARAVNDEGLSEEILKSTLHTLKKASARGE